MVMYLLDYMTVSTKPADKDDAMKSHTKSYLCNSRAEKKMQQNS